MGYWIKKPDFKGRKSFTILKRDAHGLPAHAIKSDRLASINKLFHDGVISFDVALQRVQELKEELDKLDRDKERLPANWDVFNKYWDNRYELKPDITPDSKRSAKNGLERAIESLGPLDITSSSIKDIQKHLNKLPAAQQRDRAKWLNVLLDYVNRSDRVALKQKDYERIVFLELSQFKEMVKHLPDENWRLCAWAAFGTGARFGEVMAFERVHQITKKKATITIDHQKTPNWQDGPTKNKKERTCPVLPVALVHVKKWISWVPEDVKKEMRKKNQGAAVVGAACEAAGVPKIVFHELRHSYAVTLRRSGASIAEVAECIGDTEPVCRKHYLKHAADQDVAVKLAARLFK